MYACMVYTSNLCRAAVLGAHMFKCSNWGAWDGGDSYWSDSAWDQLLSQRSEQDEAIGAMFVWVLCLSVTCVAVHLCMYICSVPTFSVCLSLHGILWGFLVSGPGDTKWQQPHFLGCWIQPNIFSSNTVFLRHQALQTFPSGNLDLNTSLKNYDSMIRSTKLYL